ncbi:DUF3575 domain-containing protein [Bacteroides sp. 224]|nr:DUF3575 domain-containing protein [Bacteroides sp. 224]
MSYDHSGLLSRRLVLISPILRKSLLALSFLIVFLLPVSGQVLTRYDVPHQYGTAIPRWGFKNNALLDATLSLNVGVEYRISKRYSIDLDVSYNPWSFDEKKFKHILVQPEFRVWLCEPFYGHFWGFHPTWSYFNVGGLRLGALKEHRYEGQLYGGGFSYGYQWYLSPRWNIEASIGLGYLYIDYDRYIFGECGDFEKTKNKHYIGPTRATVSFVYILK